MIKVVIADDHHMVRQMLVNTLAGVEDMEIVAQASNGTEAIDACLNHRPSVLVLDLNFPDVSGVEVTRRLGTLCEETGILILTAIEDEQSLFESIAAGARGYLLKVLIPHRFVFCQLLPRYFVEKFVKRCLPSPDLQFPAM